MGIVLLVGHIHCLLYVEKSMLNVQDVPGIDQGHVILYEQFSYRTLFEYPDYATTGKF